MAGAAGHEHPEGRITELVVAGEARGRGVGRALVQAAVSAAATAGSEVMEVTTALSRRDAHGFYETLGFERTSYRYAIRLGRVS